MKILKYKAFIILFMALIVVYLTGCASSRSGQVYSRDHARQAQTLKTVRLNL